MTLLYPGFLWLLIPLSILLIKGSKNIIVQVHLIVLILLVLALARPVKEEAIQDATIEAKDIIIALDISYSMQASDISPTRYAFAKETIKSLLAMNATDNIMLIAFTTNPLLLSPPTTDHALIGIALESINPEFILTKGTSLTTLFEKLSSFTQGHKNLILITDGGEENDAESLAALLQKANISLITLALGSTQGTTVPAKEGGLLKDKDGNLVITRINPILETVTSLVKGMYLNASSSPQATAVKISNALQSNEQPSTKIDKMQRHYRELYQIPLLLAILLFLTVHTRAVKYIIVLFALFGFQVEASFLDDYHLHQAVQAYNMNEFNTTVKHLRKIQMPTLQSQITLGNTYYRIRAYKQAIKTYQSIQSTSARVKQTLYYNIANAYVMIQSYSKAKNYYTKALQLGADGAAAYNLKLIAFLEDKKSASLGIAHPKSQNSDASKSESQEEENKNRNEEDQPSSGSGGGGEKSTKEQAKKNKLLHDESTQKQPLGSKAYELINKGYIRESQPW